MPDEIVARDTNTVALCSAVLARLGPVNNTLALMVVGWASFYNFMPYPAVIDICQHCPV